MAKRLLGQGWQEIETDFHVFSIGNVIAVIEGNSWDKNECVHASLYAIQGTLLIELGYYESFKEAQRDLEQEILRFKLLTLVS